jgi:hypothetical protein
MTKTKSLYAVASPESQLANNKRMADRIKNKDFWASIQTFSRNPLEFPKIVVPLHPEISPLQLKGYVDVAHSCRLYGAVSVL